MASTSKNITAELNKGEKLNGDNYDIWHRKIQYILEEQDALETLTNTIILPQSDTSAQSRKDIKIYQT